MLIKLKLSQSTAEYAILLSLVIAAAMGIQNEVKRSIQARIHQAAEALRNGEQEYEPATMTKTTTRQQSLRTKNEAFLDDTNADTTWITTHEASNADYGSTTEQ